MAVRVTPESAQQAFHRVAVIPFETAVALLLIISGVTGLTGTGVIDPISALLPHWEATVIFAVSVCAGILAIGGILTAYRYAEMAGLLILAGYVADRFILYGYYLGFGGGFLTSAVFNAAVIWAVAVRLDTLRRGRTVIQVSGHAR